MNKDQLQCSQDALKIFGRDGGNSEMGKKWLDRAAGINLMPILCSALFLSPFLISLIAYPVSQSQQLFCIVERLC